MSLAKVNGYERKAGAEVQVEFGKEMRKKHFLFADGYINLNQGSFGSHPRFVRDALRSFQDEAEAKPDSFIRYDYPDRLNEIRATLGKILNAATDELVIVPNATIGINTVLRNFSFRDGDKIVYLSTIYGAIEKTLQYLVESTPVKIVEFEITLPMSDDDLAEGFRAVLKEHGSSVKFAVFDTIVSMPGIKLPYEKLTQICRENGVFSLVDGAHGIGQIPLDLSAFQPDFLVTNCHKWLFVPRTASVFYVPFRNQHMMRSTLPTSHGFVPLEVKGKRKIFNPLPPSKSNNAFVSQFEYTGTIDNAPPLCIPAALKFRDEVCGGEERIRAYRFELAEKGEQKIAEILGTKSLAVSKASRVGFANIWLPLQAETAGGQPAEGLIPMEDISAVTNFLTEKLLEEYNCYIAILFYRGGWIARFSADIYLDLDDFIHGAEALKKLCERVKQLDYKS